MLSNYANSAESIGLRRGAAKTDLSVAMRMPLGFTDSRKEERERATTQGDRFGRSTVARRLRRIRGRPEEL